MELIRHSVSLLDDTCVLITHDELLSAVKFGKSTAPGKDGITYDIVTAAQGGMVAACWNEVVL
ncbi:hypothetical protein E2C01_033965 [Portunus trituberculatus]|uniref:Uncharacterized protein n=1 Tax=Portunus trituberculatus TaxID=210409 RepID=A0A5B7F5I1_PORTR|nr:hypothetical protein [Portunus trituberculatus]